MAGYQLLIFFFAISSMELGLVFAQDSSAQSDAVSQDAPEGRHFKRKRLCWKHGICGPQGGYQGGYQGYQGGYGNQGQLPINIAISQSQNSANGAGGGYAQGPYPNNQNGGYNGGYPNQGYYGGYSNQGYQSQGYPNQGYNNQGYYNQGYPNQGFGAGYYSENYNQYNGNGYNPSGPNGGYGFQRPPHRPYYNDNSDEGNNRPEDSESEEDENDNSNAYNDYNQGTNNYNQGQGHNYAGAYAFAGRKN